MAYNPAPQPNVDPDSPTKEFITQILSLGVEMRAADYCLALCQCINSTVPVIEENARSLDNTPNSFVIYELAKSVQISSMSVRTVSNLLFTTMNSVGGSDINSNMAFIEARRNLDSLAASLARLAERVKQISYDMPVVRPVPPPLGPGARC